MRETVLKQLNCLLHISLYFLFYFFLFDFSCVFLFLLNIPWAFYRPPWFCLQQPWCNGMKWSRQTCYYFVLSLIFFKVLTDLNKSSNEHFIIFNDHFKWYNFTYSIAYIPDGFMARILFLSLFYTKILLKSVPV